MNDWSCLYSPGKLILQGQPLWNLGPYFPAASFVEAPVVLVTVPHHTQTDLPTGPSRIYFLEEHPLNPWPQNRNFAVPMAPFSPRRLFLSPYIPLP